MQMIGKVSFCPLLAFLVVGCRTPSVPTNPKAENNEARARTIAQENTARSYWKNQLNDVDMAWDRRELTQFMRRIRTVNVNESMYPGEGVIRFDNASTYYYFLYKLDETWSAFVTWKPKDEHGGIVISTVEVLGFPDFRSRFFPDEFDTLLLIHRSPTTGRYGFDGLVLLRAVNAVIKLGQGKGAKVLEAYLDLCDMSPSDVSEAKYMVALKYQLSPARLVPILQLLSEDPDEVRGWSHEGRDLPEVPEILREALKRSEGKSWPLFPLTLEDDFPFCVWTTAGGTSGPVREALSRFKDDRSRMRSRLYTPTLNPVESVDHLIASERWKDLEVSRGQSLEAKAHVRRQAVRAIAPLLTLSPDMFPQDPSFGPSENLWTEIVEQTRKRGIHWDAARQEFVPMR